MNESRYLFASLLIMMYGNESFRTLPISEENLKEYSKKLVDYVDSLKSKDIDKIISFILNMQYEVNS